MSHTTFFFSMAKLDFLMQWNSIFRHFHFRKTSSVYKIISARSLSTISYSLGEKNFCSNIFRMLNIFAITLEYWHEHSGCSFNIDRIECAYSKLSRRCLTSPESIQQMWYFQWSSKKNSPWNLLLCYDVFVIVTKENIKTPECKLWGRNGQLISVCELMLS